MDKNQKYIWGAVIVAVIIIVGGFVITKKTSAPGISGKYDDFAKCVTEKGMTMYGAVWCPHCINEKKAFGDSFKFIKYVECPDNIQLCTDLGINGYPTWIDGAGKQYTGKDTEILTDLAKITGCELPQ